MNKRLAFFCDRDGGACHLFDIADPDSQADARYRICTADPLVMDASEDNIAVLSLDGLRRLVQQAGGGLIAVERRLSDTEQSLSIETVPVSADASPRELLLLASGVDPSWRPLDQPFTLSSGDFCLVPATAADQQNLRDFVDHLGRLPGDYRGLLLNVLRRPGIESAMRTLERRLDTASTVERPAAASRGSGIGFWLLALTLLLNLTGVGYLVSRHVAPQSVAGAPELVVDCTRLPATPVGAITVAEAHDEQQAQQEPLSTSTPAREPDSANREGGSEETEGLVDDQQQIESAEEQPVQPGSAESAQAEANESAEESASVPTPAQQAEQVLFTTWVKVDKARDAGKIYSSHLDGIDTANWRIADKENKGKVFYALAKLVLLVDEAEVNNGEKVWSNYNYRSDVKTAIKAELNKRDDESKIVPAQRALLADIACTAFSLDATADASIRTPSDSTDDVKDPVDLGMKCNAIDPIIILDTLNFLTTQLNAMAPKETDSQQ